MRAPYLSTGCERPRVILAHAGPATFAALERALRRRGVAVLRAASGPDARRLARRHPEALVALEADLPTESGWLTCAKLKLDAPDAHVILIGPRTDAEAADYAAFVGAASYVRPTDAPAAILAEVGLALSAAG